MMLRGRTVALDNWISCHMSYLSVAVHAYSNYVLSDTQQAQGSPTLLVCRRQPAGLHQLQPGRMGAIPAQAPSRP